VATVVVAPEEKVKPAGPDQANTNGPTPPVTVAFAIPLHEPKQVALADVIEIECPIAKELKKLIANNNDIKIIFFIISWFVIMTRGII
jgi:hypothetical protein